MNDIFYLIRYICFRVIYRKSKFQTRFAVRTRIFVCRSVIDIISAIDRGNNITFAVIQNTVINNIII